MALIIISLIVLVPLALLGWDLARKDKHAGTVADAPAPRAHGTSASTAIHHS